VRLLSKGHEVVPIGIRQGNTAGDLDIINGLPMIENVHTIALYISPDVQYEYYDYILNVIKPKRIIFNPGTENPEFIKLIKERGLKIEVEIACTLVMLNLGVF
jgi:hypothetical protein